jgi:hypothetical protein
MLKTFRLLLTELVTEVVPAAAFSPFAFSSPLRILLVVRPFGPDPDARDGFVFSDRWEDGLTPRQRSA